MDWIGIGVFILAIGFAVLVFFLIPVLKNLATMLDKTSETIEKSTNSIEVITEETAAILHKTNDTLADVNGKLGQLNPLFDIVHDAGESAHHLTSSLVKITEPKADRTKIVAESINKTNVDGLLRAASFVYYLLQAKKRKGNAAK